jgi:hypothetical protein
LIISRNRLGSQFDLCHSSGCDHCTTRHLSSIAKTDQPT